jgi:hypothetical protein
MADKQLKSPLSAEDLRDLAKLSTLPEWATLCRVMENRVIRDKNAIVSYPTDEPVKLAINHSFLKGRISAVYLIKREVDTAVKSLELLEEKKD